MRMTVVSVQNITDASLNLLRRHFLNLIIHRHTNCPDSLSTGPCLLIMQ